MTICVIISLGSQSSIVSYLTDEVHKPFLPGWLQGKFHIRLLLFASHCFYTYHAASSLPYSRTLLQLIALTVQSSMHFRTALGLLLNSGKPLLGNPLFEDVSSQPATGRSDSLSLKGFFFSA